MILQEIRKLTLSVSSSKEMGSKRGKKETFDPVGLIGG